MERCWCGLLTNPEQQFGLVAHRARRALWNRYQGDAIEQEIIKMEANGFLIDKVFCDTQAAIAEQDERESLERLRYWLGSIGVPPLAGCDNIWSSPKQMVQLLHEELKYPPSPVWKKGRVKVEKGDRKTDGTALEWIRGRVPKHHRSGIDEIINLRRVRGCLKYLRKLPTFVAPDGFVHPVCGPAGDDDGHGVGTITGRLAGRNPEFQQIPSDKKKDRYRIRKAFIAPPNHHIIVADYAALEVVILAHILIDLFGDHQLAEMVAPGAPDIHAFNARRVFDFLGWKVDGKRVGDYPIEAFMKEAGGVPGCQRLRQMIKEIWYGLMYGKGAFGFATSLRDEHDEPIGEEMAQKLVDALLDSVPGIRRFHAWVWEFIMRYKGMVGIGGRWLNLKELVEGDEWSKKKAARIAQNFPCQEGGAYIVGAAMVSLGKDRELAEEGLKLERQVHDELNFRNPDAWLHPEYARMWPVNTDWNLHGGKVDWTKAQVAKHMTGCVTLHVPLQVSVGSGLTWEDSK